MTSLLLTIAGQTLRVTGEGLEVEFVERDDDSELNGIPDFGAYLDEAFQAKASEDNGATGQGADAELTDCMTGEASRVVGGRTPTATTEQGRDGVERHAPEFQSASAVAPRGCSPVTTPGADESVVENSHSSAPPPEQTDTPAGSVPYAQPAGSLSNSSGLTSSQALTDMAGEAAPETRASPVDITAGPLSQSGPGGDRRTPSLDAGGAKMEGRTSASPDRPGHQDAKSRQAATPILPRERPSLRPHCLNPQLCAGSGRNHCHACRKAMDEQVAA